MKSLLVSIALLTSVLTQAQGKLDMINTAEAERIERILASDSLQGRKVFTPGIEMAAGFIINEFKKTGLKPMPGAKDYRQNFDMLKINSVTVHAQLDGVDVPEGNVVVISTKEDVTVTDASHFETVVATGKDNFSKVAMGGLQASKNTIIFLDSSFKKNMARLSNFAKQVISGSPTVIFVIASGAPSHYSVTAKLSFERKPLSNLVGILPGKSKPGEYVIFSAHYDHLGIKKAANGDSVYNGANDDAAGTTAVLMLAKYFKALNNNERTLVFVTFTAEEIGEFGSAYFGTQVNPEHVKAMFNIEMIGTESKWGKNSAYITGYDKTDMGAILQKNLQGSNFTFYPDPYTAQQLFYRSDNATLAKLGVPAHTISTSKMDNEPNYHKVSDEISTLDLANMTEIIKSIAISSQTIISGKDTPTRVKPE